MNFFYLDEDPFKSIEYHCDKHIVKMPLETAQMVCTIAHKYMSPPYLPVHAKHPCTLWGGRTKGNFFWLVMFGLALCKEYTFRYDRTHNCEKVLFEVGNECFDYLPPGVITDPPQAMPDEYKSPDVVKAYRRYYYFEKSRFAKWTKRPKPFFMEEGYYEALRA